MLSPPDNDMITHIFIFVTCIDMDDYENKIKSHDLQINIEKNKRLKKGKANMNKKEWEEVFGIVEEEGIIEEEDLEEEEEVKDDGQSL